MRNHLIRQLIGLVACVMLVAGTSPAPTANAQSPVFEAAHYVLPASKAGFKPTSQLIFNNPRGSKSQQYVIPNTIIKLLDGAPRGATIKMAYYWFDIMTVAKAAIRADKRGVLVKIVTDKRHAKSKAMKAIQSAFKKNKYSKSSVFYRSNNMLMHAKFVLVSRSGKVKNIALWGSANLSKNNAELNGNDFRIRVNSPNYDCLNSAFNRLNDRKVKVIKKGQTCTSKGLLTQLTPVNGDSPWTVRGLNRIKCTGGTKVRAMFMQWSDAAVAKAFVRKQAEGCDVQLLISRTTHKVKSKVFKALKANTKHGRVKVYVPKPGHELHYKWMAVKGRNQAWVMTGSLHPSKGSQHGIQLIVREDNKTLANSYLKQFEKLTAKHSAVRRS